MISSVSEVILDMKVMNHDWIQVPSQEISQLLTALPNTFTHKPHKTYHLAFTILIL